MPKAPIPNAMDPSDRPRGKSTFWRPPKADLSVKIIERALLDTIEPFFEGAWTWEEVPRTEYDSLKKAKSVPSNDLKVNKEACFRKKWKHRPIFLPTSHGFRPKKSTHTALRAVKDWKDTVWLLDYNAASGEAASQFENVARRRLRKTFLNNLNEPRFFKEFDKMMNVGLLLGHRGSFADAGLAEREYPTGLFNPSRLAGQGSVLSPFLFNVYMHELDRFMKELADVWARRASPSCAEASDSEAQCWAARLR